ncbi:MAG: carbohydrate binding domain-containing protein [Candidatus Woesearchaeota archaeon]|nr:MAG: carbohydrate binding domain-containing protein [Candidatus Woesearchaeota archaeon]
MNKRLLLLFAFTILFSLSFAFAQNMPNDGECYCVVGDYNCNPGVSSCQLGANGCQQVGSYNGECVEYNCHACDPNDSCCSPNECPINDGGVCNQESTAVCESPSASGTAGCGYDDFGVRTTSQTETCSGGVCGELDSVFTNSFQACSNTNYCSDGSCHSTWMIVESFDDNTCNDNIDNNCDQTCDVDGCTSPSGMVLPPDPACVQEAEEETFPANPDSIKYRYEKSPLLRTMKTYPLGTINGDTVPEYNNNNDCGVGIICAQTSYEQIQNTNDYSFVTVTDGNGNSLVSKIDKLGNVVEVRGPEGTVASSTYDSLGRIKTATDPNNRLVLKDQLYNSLGQLVGSWSLDTGYAEVSYDDLGRVNYSIDSRGLKAEPVYDVLDRVVYTEFSCVTQLTTKIGPYTIPSPQQTICQQLLANTGATIVNHYDTYVDGGSCLEGSDSSIGLLCELEGDTSIKYTYDLKGNVVRVEEIGLGSKNLVLNGDFEHVRDGLPVNWKVNQVSGMSYALDEGRFESTALRVTNGGATGWSSRATSDVVYLSEGDRYTASVYAKAEPGTLMRVWFGSYCNDVQEPWNEYTELVADGSWQRLVATTGQTTKCNGRLPKATLNVYAPTAGTSVVYDQAQVTLGSSVSDFDSGATFVTTYAYDDAGNVKSVTTEKDQTTIYYKYDRMGRLVRVLLPGKSLVTNPSFEDGADENGVPLGWRDRYADDASQATHIPDWAWPAADGDDIMRVVNTGSTHEYDGVISEPFFVEPNSVYTVSAKIWVPGNAELTGTWELHRQIDTPEGTACEGHNNHHCYSWISNYEDARWTSSIPRNQWVEKSFTIRTGDRAFSGTVWVATSPIGTGTVLVDDIKVIGYGKQAVKYEYGDENGNGEKVGLVKKVDFPNNVDQRYSYNSRGWLDTLSIGSMFSESYMYDNVGTLTSMDGNEGSVSFLYDDLYRLTAVNDQGYYDTDDFSLTSLGYVYDGVGNRLSRSVSASDEDIVWDETYQYASNTNRLASDSKCSSYTYDAVGNLIRKVCAGVETTITFDAYGRIVRYVEGDLAQQYTYDPIGRRIHKQSALSDVTYSFGFGSSPLMTVERKAGLLVQVIDPGQGGEEHGEITEIKPGTGSDNELSGEREMISSDQEEITEDNTPNTLTINMG